MPIDFRMERDVLSKCLQDREYLRIAAPLLSGYEFTPGNRWVWSVIREVWDNDQQLVPPILFRHRVESLRDASDEQRRRLLEQVRDLYTQRPQIPYTALEEIRKLLRVSYLRQILEDGERAYDAGDYERAEEAILRGSEWLRGLSIASDLYFWAERYGDRRESYLAGPEHLVRTPFRSLDAITSGGLRPGNFGIIVANTNVGKSAFAVDVGYAALEYSDAVVLHFCTEESIVELAARYDARQTGIPKERLVRRALTETDVEKYAAYMARAKEKYRNRLILYELSPGSSQVGEVGAALLRVREIYPTEVVVVVVDSADDLLPDLRQESFRLGAKRVYTYLKSIALNAGHKYGNVIVWSTAQAHRAAEGKIAKTASVSESYDKPQKADIQLSLKEEPSKNNAGDETLMRIYVAKNRLGGKKLCSIYARANLGTCKFREVRTRIEIEREDDL